MSVPAIQLHQVGKTYRNGTVALQGVDLTIRPSEFVSLVGPSGCGKSTLLRCFNRLESINGGKLIVNDIDLSHPESLSAKQLRRLRATVGMVFQQFNLFPHLSVLENLTLAPQKVLGMSTQDSKQTAGLFLEKVGLLEKAHAYPEQLSGGQKQRVAIARALVSPSPRPAPPPGSPG